MSNVNNGNSGSRTVREGEISSRRSREASSLPLVRQNAAHSSPETREGDVLDATKEGQDLEEAMPSAPPVLNRQNAMSDINILRATYEGGGLSFGRVRERREGGSTTATVIGLPPSMPTIEETLSQNMTVSSSSDFTQDSAFQAQIIGTVDIEGAINFVDAVSDARTVRSLDSLEPLEAGIAVQNTECPITLTEPTAENAVYILCGENRDKAHIFDRASLEGWLRVHDTHPLTREKVTPDLFRKAKSSEES